jgi:hypothetical protein
MECEVVRVREPRTGPATAATHQCLWGACAAGVTLAALSPLGVWYASPLAIAVGLLTTLPRVGPMLGVLAAGTPVALSQPVLGIGLGIAVALIGLPAQHLPRWLGPLSPGATAASVVLGGAFAAVPGAVGALALAAALAPLLRRLARRA